jgi:uncharacterized membrane protein
MDTIGGLVAHPLLVHIPVVLVPLAMVGTVLMALRPGLRRSFGMVVVVLAGIGFVGALLASNSGESLEERYVASGQSISGTLADHAEMGETAPWIAGVFFVAVTAWVFFCWWRQRAGEERVTAAVKKPRAVAGALLALAVLTGAAASVSVVRTGHSGATSVWEDTAP